MTTTKNKEGYALIVVIWALVLISALAIGIATSVRIDTQNTIVLKEQAQALAAAEAGIQHALLKILSKGQHPPLNQWLELNWHNTEVRYQVRTEKGKINLNYASSDLIAGLYRQIPEIPRNQAPLLVDRLKDWTDFNQEARPNGNEAYMRNGRKILPPNRPLFSLNELTQIPGYTLKIFSALFPYVTVIGDNGKIDPMLADQVVIFSLPRLSKSDAKAFIHSRDNVHAESQKTDFSLLAPANPYISINYSPSLFDITAEARLPSGYRVRIGEIVYVNSNKSSFRTIRRNHISLLASHDE